MDIPGATAWDAHALVATGLAEHGQQRFDAIATKITGDEVIQDGSCDSVEGTQVVPVVDAVRAMVAAFALAIALDQGN